MYGRLVEIEGVDRPNAKKHLGSSVRGSSRGSRKSRASPASSRSSTKGIAARSIVLWETKEGADEESVSSRRSARRSCVGSAGRSAPRISTKAPSGGPGGRARVVDDAELLRPASLTAPPGAARGSGARPPSERARALDRRLRGPLDTIEPSQQLCTRRVQVVVAIELEAFDQGERGLDVAGFSDGGGLVELDH